MWANYLNTAANITGGIPQSYYTVGNTTTGSYILFNKQLVDRWEPPCHPER